MMQQARWELVFNRHFDFLYAAKLALDFVAKARIGGVTKLGWC